MFGPRLTRDYGDSVPDAWKQSIGQLKDFEITRGIRRIAFGGSGSPPTLPQFLKACRTIGEDEGPSNPGRVALPPVMLHVIDAHANKCLIAYLDMSKEPTSAELLQKFVREKNRIAADYRSIESVDDELTGKEIRIALFAALDRVKNIREAA